MSRGLFSLVAVWFFTAVIAVQASLTVADATDEVSGSDVAWVIVGQIVLLASCLWIARVEGALREIGRDSAVIMLRVTQGIVVGGFLLVFLGFLAVVGGGIWLFSGEDAALTATIGPAADEELLASTIVYSVGLAAGAAFVAALISVPFYLLGVPVGATGRRPSPFAGALESVVDGLKDGFWAVVPLVAEFALVVVDAIQVMSSNGVSTIGVLGIVLVPVASIPGLIERWTG